MPTVPPTPSKQPATPNTPAETRKHWSEAFKEQRKQQVRISRSRAWRTLARTRQQAFLFLIRNLWIVPLLVVFMVVCCLLASHSLPGLQPDPVTSIKLH